MITVCSGRRIPAVGRRSEAHVHVMVVAHPTKIFKGDDGEFPVPTLYQISDSAHWYNKADLGVGVHRQTDGKTLVRVAKSRYHQKIGTPGDVSLMFNPETMKFSWADTSGSSFAA